MWVSALMAAVGPVLAGLLSVMRAFGVVERSEAEQSEREAERSLQLRMYKIEQAERTRREHLIEQERTKQVRAQARAEQARARGDGGGNGRGNGHKANGGNGRVKPGELDARARTVLMERPGIGPRPLGRELGCSPSTAAGILKRLK